MGIAATGKAVTLTGITILRIEHGKIAARWGSADQLGLLQQLEMRVK
jgi:predicted ester cyclase